jgi:acetyl-CoA/propionyl-CoA carboxylase, biotin carboxylase, biotin carboxyl carrier protein
MPPFEKVLVANRGEIAIRVFRTLRELGIGAVAVYSEADREALFVREADEAYLIGPPPAAESYLRADVIVGTAVRAGARAVHPGYGFLAENAPFARACAEAGLVFIGPPPEAIEGMGGKVESRALMAAVGVPIVPGTTEPVDDLRRAGTIADEIGYPVAVKASAGGGGKGLRVAATPADLEGAFEGARREGERFFADGAVYLERYLDSPRHVEVQILADDHGTTIALGERDCSVQRRHQKLVEETPSPAISDDLRARMMAAAVRAAEAVGYRSAGTVEFLVSGEAFFFLEMNARVQVEHTITEAVLGIDIVREQIAIAGGEPISRAARSAIPRGHAFECRINAEDPRNGFAPTPGRITGYREPGGPGVRVDSGVVEGSEISGVYDPMISKLIVWDVDREAARRRMLRALGEYVIEGPRTLLPFHRWLFQEPEFIAGGTCHGPLARLEAGDADLLGPDDTAPAAPAAGQPAPAVRSFTAEVDGKRLEIRISSPDVGAPAARAGGPRRGRRERSGRSKGGARSDDPAALVSPMQGTVLSVAVAVGAVVAEGDPVAVVEAMKMENDVLAHRAGRVSEVAVEAGQTVDEGALLVRIEAGGPEA